MTDGTSPYIESIVPRHPGLTVLGELRRGGQKSAWKVSYEAETYALKVVKCNPESVERAKREINIMRKCQCPRLVALGPLDLQEIGSGDERLVYYLEQFVSGTPLDAVPKPMALAACRALGLQLAEAVNCLWAQGFVHRDIKPSNIIQAPGGRDFVLLDVGLALDLSAPSITAPGGIVGTPMYLSPDQLKLKKRQLDFRSDLHAIGLCMYECIGAVHPLWNERVQRLDLLDNILHMAPLPLKQFRSQIPDLLEEIVLRLLEKEPHLRYARIEHFTQDLERVSLQ